MSANGSMKLSDFSLLKEDDSTYHIGHPKGKAIAVSKRGLSDQAQKLISKLKREQGFAKGDEVPDFSENRSETPSDAPPESEESLRQAAESAPAGQAPKEMSARDPGIAQKLGYAASQLAPGVLASGPAGIIAPAVINTLAPAVSDFIKGASGDQSAYEASGQEVQRNTASEKGEAPEAPQAPSQAAPLASQNDANADLLQAQKDLQAGVQAQEAAGTNMAKAHGEVVKQIQELQTKIAARKQDFDAKDEAAYQGFANKKLDADRYLNQRGLGSKITSAIAMILGGIGQGLAGGDNPAQTFMRDAIDRDIDAQKNDQTKAMNLWKMNREKYATDQEADLATQNQYLLMAQHKVDQAASGTMGAIAKQNAIPLKLSIANQIAQNNQQRAILAALGPGGDLSSMNPAVLVPIKVPKEHQKEVFHEIKQAQDTKQNHQKIMKLFDQAAGENTLVGRATHLGYNPASILGMNALELPMLKDQEGRVNEYEQKTLNDLHPLPGDSPAKIAQKRKTYEAFVLNKESAPRAEAFGIPLNRFQSTFNHPTRAPGSIIKSKGRQYRVGRDGYTIEPI